MEKGLEVVKHLLKNNHHIENDIEYQHLEDQRCGYKSIFCKRRNT